MMRMYQSELERADAGLQMLADDVQSYLRKYDRTHAIPKQKSLVKLRFIDVLQLIVVSGVALAVVYAVIWLLTHILPSW